MKSYVTLLNFEFEFSHKLHNYPQESKGHKNLGKQGRGSQVCHTDALSD